MTVRARLFGPTAPAAIAILGREEPVLSPGGPRALGAGDIVVRSSQERVSEDAGSVHLAQVNMGRVKTSLDSPLLAGFVARLDEINALADRSPGFGWRLETPEGNATDLRPHDDDRILINMSVWESLDHLKAFVFRSSHRELLQQRRDWCEKFEGVYAALCWVLLGHRPPIEEAKDRLAHLAKKGPAPCAFSFRGRPGPSVAPPSRNFLPPPGAAGRSP